MMAFAVSPLAFADPAVPPVSEAAPEVVVSEPVKDGKTDEPVMEANDGSPPDCASQSGVAVEPSSPANGGETVGEASVIPIDWVKRGGGDNPEISYNMAGGEAPVFKAEITSTAKEFGPDGRVADIESKENTGAPLIERAKKGPVALLKKGRVFLR